MCIIRPLTFADSIFADRIASLYGHLTQYGTLTIDKVDGLLKKIHAQGSVVLGAWIADILVGLTTVMIEYKMIRGGSCVGHIEDVVVDPLYQGQGIGQHLINEAKRYAHTQGCYKVILDCDEKLITWYQQNGFVQKGVCMRRDCGIDM